MALSSTRMEYRIALSHVDRGLDRALTVIAALHPSETAEHLALRVLAYCLLYEERIEFGAGLADPTAPDLWARDLTGQVTLWVECGAADGEKLRRVLQHNAGAAVHAVFSGDRRLRDLQDEVAGWTRAARGLERVTLWTLDAALVSGLAAAVDTGRRHQLSVTIVGDHFYVESDGQHVEGAAVRGALTQAR